MRTYSIDQLRDADTKIFRERLTEAGLQGGIAGIFWLPVPDSLLTATQMEHKSECGPYYLALDVDDEALHLELLVRGMGRITCQCVSFASEALRDHMIAYVEDSLRELDIPF